jgi:Putative Flp pilus-assembly TadE/G-like
MFDRQKLGMKRDRHGIAIIWAVIALTAITAIVSLAVDLGRVQLVKTQLQRVADAAARYGAQGLESGNGITWATASATEQTVNGSPYTVVNGDIVTGNWSGSAFTAGGSPMNAIKVTAACTAARGNAVSLFFGRVIGETSCDVHAKSVAMYVDNPTGGFIGLNKFTVKNNTFVASYNSSNTTLPTHAGAGNKGLVGSNGSIVSGNNDLLQGDALLGPSGSVTGFAISGNTTTQTSPIAAPTMPAWSPGTNPGSIPSTYTVSSSVTLPHGTYWFTSLSITGSGTLSFDGPSTVYVNGPIDLLGNIIASASIPSNLKIYQYGSNMFGDAAGSANNTTVIADVMAPTCDFLEKNAVFFYGRGFFNSITDRNNADFYYDGAEGSAIGGKTITTVQ